VENFGTHFGTGLSKGLEKVFARIRAAEEITPETQYQFKVEVCKWMTKSTHSVFIDKLWDEPMAAAKSFLKKVV